MSHKKRKRKTDNEATTSEGISIEELVKRLEELINWCHFAYLPKLRDILLNKLDSDVERRAYEMTDGTKSRRDIAAALNISDDTVQGWWNKWWQLGIVKSSKRVGRPQHIFSLEEVGIKIPKITYVKKRNKTRGRKS